MAFQAGVGVWDFIPRALTRRQQPGWDSGGLPRAAGAVPAGFLYNGAPTTHGQLGVERDRMIGKHRWVVVRCVEPAR